METVIAETLPTVKVAILARAGLYKTGELRFPGMFLRWSKPYLTVMFDGGLVYEIEAAVKAGRVYSLTCPVCGQMRKALYLREGQLACRACNHLRTIRVSIGGRYVAPETLDEVTKTLLAGFGLRR